MGYGDAFKRVRKFRRVAQEELAAKAGASGFTIRRIEKSSPEVRFENRAAVAAALDAGFDWTTGEIERPTGMSDSAWLAGVGRENDFPADSPTDIKIGMPVPEFDDLDVAASHFKDGDTAGVVSGDDVIARGLFRIKINGDCMSTDYNTGDLVEFELCAPGAGMEVGDDVYLQTSDGATFKRVFKKTRSSLTIGCIHGEEKRWTVPLADIVRAAVAVGVFYRRRR